MTGTRPTETIPAHVIHDQIIAPVLRGLARIDARLDTPAARRLLLGTAAHESGGFRAIFQARGPARSLWQIEPRTGLQSVIDWLSGHADLADAVGCWAWAWEKCDWADQYAWNHHLACALARVYYWRIAAPMPADIAGLAGYWKRYYNTLAGKGTAEDWLAAYRQHCAGVIP